MPRVVGLDPGTQSVDLCGLDDGRVFLEASIGADDARRAPAALVDRLEAALPLDLIAAPSGYGLPLVPVAALSASRWAPLLTVALAALIALAGGGLARAGFAIIRPEPAIEEAVAQDPTSHLAVAYRIARENGTPVMTYTGRAKSITWALLPALALGVMESRRRAVLGSLAFALLFLGTAGWNLAQLPALRGSLPTMSQIAAGLFLVLAAGSVGGLIGQWLGAALTPRPA